MPRSPSIATVLLTSLIVGSRGELLRNGPRYRTPARVSQQSTSYHGLPLSRPSQITVLGGLQPRSIFPKEWRSFFDRRQTLHPATRKIPHVQPPHHEKISNHYLQNTVDASSVLWTKGIASCEGCFPLIKLILDIARHFWMQHSLLAIGRLMAQLLC